jgi:DNA-binding response OmpR family regulator
MEMEDEKNAETNSATDDSFSEEVNLSEDENEITVEGDDLGDFDFDVISDEDEDVEEQGGIAESDLTDLDFDVVTEEDEDELEEDNEDAELDFEKDDELDNLPPLEESDLLNIDLEEPFESPDDFAETAQQDDFLHKFDDDDLSPLSYAGKQLVIFDMVNEQAELLKKYLGERTGMEVECVSKKENLWRFLKIDPLDLIILETDSAENSDALELMQQTKDQFPEVHFICISGPVSLERRLQFLNAGALDYLMRPLHLSTIAQSILVQFSHTDIYDDEDFADLESQSQDIPLEESIIDSTETLAEINSGGIDSLPDEDSKLPKEIDLLDEDF